VQIQEKPTKF